MGAERLRWVECVTVFSKVQTIESAFLRKWRIRARSSIPRIVPCRTVGLVGMADQQVHTGFVLLYWWRVIRACHIYLVWKVVFEWAAEKHRFQAQLFSPKHQFFFFFCVLPWTKVVFHVPTGKQDYTARQRLEAFSCA